MTKPEMPTYFGNNTTYGVDLLYVPQIGTFLDMGDKHYEIVGVTTYQEKPDKDVLITHVLRCAETDQDGDFIGNELINIKITENSDIYGITVP